jgi:hypothetical protein
VSLSRRQLLFRIRRWVKPPFRPVGSRPVARSLVRLTRLQSKIMRDAEDPSAKVLPRPAQLEMAEEGQEHFLDDLLGVVHGYAERKGIPEQRPPPGP